jgi:oligoribonuclease
MAAADRLVWIDCEMTGLDLAVDELVEVAVVVTDYELKPLDPGFDIVIKPSDAAVQQMSDVVRQMHASSGLLEALPAGAALAEAEQQVLTYLQRFTTAGQAPIAGNTIGTDRSFLVRHMPALDAHLHYRSVDVSSIKELAKRWYPRVYYNAPAKHGGHRALADILESIRELDYYRRAIFVPEPGPTSEQAQAAAAEVVEAFASALAT